MAYDQDTRGATRSVPFAHAYDETTDTQVPVMKVIGTVDGGGGGGAAVDFEFLLVADANDVPGLMRIAEGDTRVYTTLAGDAWVPVQPIKPILGAAGVATAALQTTGNTALTGISGKLPASLGPKTAAASLSVAPATDANVAREVYGTVTILNLQTNAVGTTFNPFGAQACSSLDILNNTTADIEVRRGAAGSTLTIPAGLSRLMQGITNANQIQLRRKDQSNTQVTVEAEAYSV